MTHERGVGQLRRLLVHRQRHDASDQAGECVGQRLTGVGAAAGVISGVIGTILGLPLDIRHIAFASANLGHRLPGHGPADRLRLQLRVNNVLNATPPRYANDPSGAGVQPYGDWRGRIYSLSVLSRF